jgi:hypothetical protein
MPAKLSHKVSRYAAPWTFYEFLYANLILNSLLLLSRYIRVLVYSVSDCKSEINKFSAKDVLRNTCFVFNKLH